MRRFTVPKNSTGTKVSSIYEAVSTYLAKHTAEPIELIVPDETIQPNPSSPGSNESTDSFQENFVSLQEFSSASATKKASYLAEISKSKSMTKVHLEIDDDEEDADNTEMVQLRSAVRTTLASDAKTNSLFHAVLGSKIALDCENFQNSIRNAFSINNPIEEIYHEKRAYGRDARNEGESDTTYHKRKERNKMCRESRRRTKSLFQLYNISHTFYKHVNTITEDLIRANRPKMVEQLNRLKMCDHPQNPLYDILQTKALDAYKKEYLLPKGQLMINRFILENCMVFEL